MLSLDGATAVVTGGARRLGAAIALALARAGCNLVINYRSAHPEAQATARAACLSGVRAITVRGDLTQTDAVAELLDAAVAAFGRVDVLVANAGAFRRTPLATLAIADWDDMLDDNLRVSFLCARCFGLHMQAHGGGAVIFIADVAGLRPWVDYLPYSLAKAGVITLTYALAKELAPAVRVNAIAPGPILFPDDFDAAARQREINRTLLRRAGDPQHITEAVLLLARNDYITGAVLPVDGGRLLS